MKVGCEGRRSVEERYAEEQEDCIFCSAVDTA